MASNGNPFHEISADAALSAVVEAGRAGIGMAGEVLHVLQRRAVQQQVGDRGYPKRVGRKMRRQPGPGQSALDHAADIGGGEGARGEPIGPPLRGPKKRRVRRIGRQARHRQVGREHLFQVGPDRNLPEFATFLMESQLPLSPVVPKVLESQPRHGTDSGSRIYKDRQDGPVPQTDQPSRVDRLHQLADLSHRDFWRAAFDHLMSRAANRERRIQDHDMPDDESVEEPANGGQMEFAGGVATGMFVEVLADLTRLNLVQRHALRVQPRQESSHRVLVGLAGVRIANLATKEFFPGELGRTASIGDDCRIVVWPAESRLGAGLFNRHQFGAGFLNSLAFHSGSRSCWIMSFV